MVLILPIFVFLILILTAAVIFEIIADVSIFLRGDLDGVSLFYLPTPPPPKKP